MKKQNPKQPASETTKRPAPVGNGETAQGAAAGITAANIYQYNREQVRLFISELPNDCAIICDTVKNSLYDDGAGLLEDEKLYNRLGRIAHIDNFIRDFGGYFEVEDLLLLMEEMAMRDKAAQEVKNDGVVDMKTKDRLPTLDLNLLQELCNGEDEKSSFRNVSLYYFSLWVKFHVGAVVSMFRKWVEVYGENVPPVLRDMSALARCDCGYIRTADNAHGGIFYDGGWFESFAMCGERRRKRNAAANETAQRGAADRKPDTGAADRDTAAARELLHGKPDAAKGAANPSGGAGVINLYGDMIINTAKPIQVNAPAPAKQKPAEPVTDGETKEGEPVAGHIGTWAKEQGATDYYVGFSVRIRGTICPLPPLNQKRGRVISELIETENELGAVKCDIHSALGGDTSSAEYEKIAEFLERVNAGKIGKAGSNKFSGCWHIKPAPVRR